jgi:hypothetical protein
MRVVSLLFSCLFPFACDCSQASSSALSNLKFPHDHITYTQYLTSVRLITEDEYLKKIPCSFHGTGGIKQGTANCHIEIIEHKLVQKYIQNTSVVLELGGRYGTTSCVIANQLQNNGKLVVVEPDSRVWSSLNLNRQSHSCNFYFVKKPIGNTSVTIRGNNYDSTSEIVTATRGRRIRIPPKLDPTRRPNYYNYHELETILRLKFNTLLIDCEGCLPQLFQSSSPPSPRLSSLESPLNSLHQTLKHVNLIILEADNSIHPLSPCRKSCVNYSMWIDRFHDCGLEVVERVLDKRFPWIDHLVFQRRWDV